MLLTLLGVVALILRERRKANMHSGQHEKMNQITCKGQEVNEFIEEQSLEERICSHSNANDDQSAAILHHSTESNFCCSVNNPQTTVFSTYKGCDEGPQTAVCVMANSINKVPQTSVISKDIDDCPPTFFGSKFSNDVLLASGHLASDLIVDVPQSSQQQEYKRTIIDINSRSYETGCKLGEGGFGNVFAATRLEDGLQVAIKFVSNEKTEFISIEGYSNPLPTEIALQILVNQGPRVDEIIELLDWEVKTNYYYMVLERPIPCQALNSFVKGNKGTINEDIVRIIMRQATVAAQTCCQRGVFHRDIKMENLLINPETLKIKLIDFGCGELLTDTAYTSFSGTYFFRPPELIKTLRYHGKPATVWSLGILMFTMIFRRFPTNLELRNFSRESQIIKGLSKECVHFLGCCLKIRPDRRMELEELGLHDWFKGIDDAPKAAVCATSKSSDDHPPLFLTVKSKSSHAVPQTPVCATFKSSDDRPPLFFTVTYKFNEDVPQSLVCATSKDGEDRPPMLFSVSNSQQT